MLKAHLQIRQRHVDRIAGRFDNREQRAIGGEDDRRLFGGRAAGTGTNHVRPIGGKDGRRRCDIDLDDFHRVVGGKDNGRRLL